MKYHGDQRVFLTAVVPVLLLTFLLQEGPKPLYPGPPLTSVLVPELLPRAQTYWLGAVRKREVVAVSQPSATPREEDAVATVISVRTP